MLSSNEIKKTIYISSNLKFQLLATNFLCFFSKENNDVLYEVLSTYINIYINNNSQFKKKILYFQICQSKGIYLHGYV